MMGLLFSEQTECTVSPRVNKKIFTFCHECTLLLGFGFFSASQFEVRYFLLFFLFVKLLEYILCI